MKRFHHVLLVMMVLAILTSGCAAKTSTSDQNFTWQIKINSAETKTELITTEITTLYNGEKKSVPHDNYPSSGDVFLLLDLTISKNGSNSIIFEWNDLVVEDADGNTYHRLENDSFLQQHNYSPRLTGLPIRFGENQGWICFEIPASAADGKLYLVHTTSEGQLKTQIKK